MSQFPPTNKIPQQMPEDAIEGNAKLLEQSMNRANWRVLLKYYFSALGVLLITVFSIIAVIRLALLIA